MFIIIIIIIIIVVDDDDGDGGRYEIWLPPFSDGRRIFIVAKRIPLRFFKSNFIFDYRGENNVFLCPPVSSSARWPCQVSDPIHYYTS